MIKPVKIALLLCLLVAIFFNSCSTIRPINGLRTANTTYELVVGVPALEDFPTALTLTGNAQVVKISCLSAEPANGLAGITWFKMTITTGSSKELGSFIDRLSAVGIHQVYLAEQPGQLSIW